MMRDNIVNGAANPHCIGFNAQYKNFQCMLIIASTTHKDLHGLRMSKESLADFEEAISKKYYPLQLNHDDSGPRLGVIVSAKVFAMPDGETALGAIVILHSDLKIASAFPAGAKNTIFGEYRNLIDVKALMFAHEVKMLTYVQEEQPLEEMLESFLRSHTVGSNGRIRTNKYLITKTGDFRIYLYPKDHRPAHFHVVSKQRNIDARFSIEPIELLSIKQGKISKNDEKIIKLFFKTHPNELRDLKRQAERLQLKS